MPSRSLENGGGDTSECCPPAGRVQFDAFIKDEARVNRIGNGECKPLDDATVSEDAGVVQQYESVRVRRFVFDEPE